jgi:NodT family efflux transporter outer membrane factor (OMF) lipoprotein
MLCWQRIFMNGKLLRTWIKRIGLMSVAFAGMGSFLTSCMVGPDYRRPEVVTPVAYKEGDGWKIAQPKDDVIRGAWWEIFNEPQLSAIEEQIGISNQNVIAAEARFQQARALVREARAGYFPTVTFGPGVTHARTPGLTSASGGSARTTTDYSLPIDVAWELDVWGRIRRTVESNQASAQASAADLEAARLSYQAALAQDYFQLRTYDAQKQLLDATVAAYQKSLELTKNRYAGGVASQAEVAQAETQLKTTQAQDVDVGVQRAQTEHAIALLLGEAASTFSLPTAPLVATPPSIPIGTPSELLERRPDIAVAERNMAAANAQIGIAEAAFFPTVTLSASGGFESTSLSQWLTWPMRFWSVGAGISETVYDGGLRRAQTDYARAAYEASVATYRQTVLTAFQTVEDNLAALRILEDEAHVQDEAVKAARQSTTLTLNQYKAGLVSYLNVITTQTIALSNEITAVQILGRRMTAAVLLVEALGGGWNVADLPSIQAVTER